LESLLLSVLVDPIVYLIKVLPFHLWSA